MHHKVCTIFTRSPRRPHTERRTNPTFCTFTCQNTPHSSFSSLCAHKIFNPRRHITQISTLYLSYIICSSTFFNFSSIPPQASLTMAELAALMKCGRCQGWFIGDDALRAHYPCMPEDPDNGGGKPTALPLSKVLGHPTSVIRTTGARFSPADADLSSIESQEVADPRPAPPAVAPVIPEREYTMADLQHRQYSVTLQEEFGFVYPSVSHFSELALIERRRFFAWDCPIPSCLFLTNSHTSKKSTGTEPEQHQIAHMFLLLCTYTIYPPDKQNHEVAGRLY